MAPSGPGGSPDGPLATTAGPAVAARQSPGLARLPTGTSPPARPRGLLRQAVSGDVRGLQVLPLAVLHAVDADDLVDGVAAVVELCLAQRALVGRDGADSLEDLGAVLFSSLLDRLDD